MTRLAGKAAIVTGAAQGIGRGIAQALAAAGASVTLADIADEEGAQAAAELRAAGAAVEYRHADVTVEGDVRSLVEAAAERWGQLDIVVNNAGIVSPAPIDTSRLDDWDRHIRVNLTGVYLGCREAMRAFIRQGRGGVIVNLSSVAGIVGVRDATAYTASKGGVRLLTKTIALEGGPHGIRCNSVHPGVIATEMTGSSLGNYSSDVAALAAAVPLGRMGRPEDIAAAIAYLASPDAAYVTGTELVVDGGMIAQ